MHHLGGSLVIFQYVHFGSPLSSGYSVEYGKLSMLPWPFSKISACFGHTSPLPFHDCPSPPVRMAMQHSESDHKSSGFAVNQKSVVLTCSANLMLPFLPALFPDEHPKPIPLLEKKTGVSFCMEQYTQKKPTCSQSMSAKS